MAGRLIVAFVLLTLLPFTAYAQVDQAQQLIEDDRHDEAKPLLAGISKSSPDYARSLYLRGRIAFREDKIDEAIKLLEEAVRLEDDSDYNVWLGMVYIEKTNHVNLFKKKGLAGKAKACFIKAVELGPDNPDARSALAEYYMEAPGFAGGDKKKSLQHVNVLKTLDAREGARLAARLHAKEDDYDQAEQELMSLSDGTTDDAELFYEIAFMYQEAKKWDKAFEWFEKSIESDAAYTSSMYQIGRTAVFSKQNLDRAEECLKQYLEQEPADHQPSLAYANYRLGMLYEIRKDEVQARKSYEIALALEPDHSEAKKALKKLKRR